MAAPMTVLLFYTFVFSFYCKRNPAPEGPKGKPQGHTIQYSTHVIKNVIDNGSVLGAQIPVPPLYRYFRITAK